MVPLARGCARPVRCLAQLTVGRRCVMPFIGHSFEKGFHWFGMGGRGGGYGGRNLLPQ